MILYRIAKCDYVADLTGTGSRLYGGRWNSEGKPALYLASSRSLAMLEVLVHLPPLMIPDDYCIAEIEVPDNSIAELNLKELPDSWNAVSPPNMLKQIGDSFLKSKSNLMLKIPSAIVPAEYNYLLNTLHKDMIRVKVKKQNQFEFDSRLV